MRWVSAIATVVIVVAGMALSGTRATADTTSGLSVITSPDPSATASVAYIYSPAPLTAAPRVVVRGPGMRWAGIATFERTAAPGQWWDAALPGGFPGIYQVTVTATTGTGTASYEITSGAPQWGWKAAGPALDGGLMAVDPSRARSVYMASALAGELFATHDGGGSWQMERTLPVAGGYPTALLTAGRTLIMGINGGNGLYVNDPTYTGKVLASEDGGEHWRDLGMPDSFVRTVLADGRTLIAVTNSGIELTSDQGESWRTVAVPWSPSDYSGATLAGSDLYVATLSGLYVVRDITGTPSAPALAFAPAQSPWVVAVAGDAGHVYADAFRGGLYASADGGRTWTHVYNPPSYVQMLDDVGGRLYMSGVNSILVSGDGGQDWATWQEPVAGLDVTNVSAVGGTVYVGTEDGGVFTTRDDGASYQWLGGISDLNGYGVGVAGDGEVIAGTDRGTFRAAAAAAFSGDPGAWGQPFPLPVYNVATPIVATSPDHGTVYKVVEGPRIGTFTMFSSTDSGATWHQLGVTNYGAPGAMLAESGTLYVAGSSNLTGSTLLTSHDGGTTWTSVTLPGVITALAGDPSDPARLWLGGPGGLWTSADGGQTFTQLQSVPVSALDALSGNRLIVAGDQFYTSSDGGVTLRPAREPDLDLNVTALLGVGRVLYAGTGAFHQDGLLKGGHGVLRSTDGGVSWQLFSAGLTDQDVLSLAASPDGRRLFAGTLRGGVFMLPLR
jgi:hypothetical protein